MARSVRRAWRVLLLAMLWPLVAHATMDEAVLMVDIEGPIGPATADHVEDALDEARDRDASAVVLRIDTPGGLDTAMRDIIREIIASPVPVVGYVAPSGARAASAGTYIMFATHVAAMAPATTLGAATPIRIGGLSPPEGTPPETDDGDDGDDGDDAAAPTDTAERKLISDARAYIRGLARLRGRNADWAERAVTEAASLTAREALEQDVVDVVASDLPTLLEQIDGRRVEVLGNEVVLRTAGAAASVYEPSWRTRVLSIIADPNVAYVLLMLGLYGLLFELSNPGFFVPGVVGAISLVLALFAFAALPINWAGLALMLLGVAFMIGEVFVPSFGALGIGGVLAFIVGSILLMDIESEFFQLSIGLVVGLTIASAAFFIGVVGLALRSRRAAVVSGREELIGGTGVTLSAFDESGQVQTHGEIWRARTDTPLRGGESVRIRGVRGLTLDVEPIEGASDDDIRESRPRAGENEEDET